MTDYPEKYDTRIDAETWDFIRQTERWYPPDAATLTIDQQRTIYDRMCREFFAGYPENVSADDGAIDAGTHQIPVRRYFPAESDETPQVVYLHGGGFVVGGLESHDDVCAEICSRTGYRVTSVDYRLSPEHPFPDDINDALVAFRSIIAESSGPLVLAGDSAGGNLAAAVAHITRLDRDRAAGQVLIYPGLGGKLDWGTFIDHADAPMLTTADTRFYKSIRSGGDNALLTDSAFAPLADNDFSRLPPTVVISAECDPLSGDGEAYSDKIREAGGRAVWFNETGLVHGYLRARHTVARARESFTRICEAISALGKGDWPYPTE